MVTGWIDRFLPIRGGLAQVGGIERQQVAEILRSQARRGVRRDGILRIESDVGTLHAIEELEIADQRRVRKDVLQVPDFAPAVVAQHDVGIEARIAQVHGNARDFLRIENGGFGISQVVVHLHRDAPAWLVDQLPDARERAIGPLGDEHDLVTALRAEISGQLQVLPREVLMDKKNLHYCCR